MASPAALEYLGAAERIQALRKAATDKDLRSTLSPDEIQVYYHAALAAYVAAWEAYVSNLVRDFYSVISGTLNPGSRAIYAIAQQSAERALERFNTPNWENTRNLLVQCTGYDAINDWKWSRRGMGSPLIRGRLNEILKVRHSFAHGFGMPAYNWTQSPSGKVRLTSKGIQETEAFFKNLVTVTDNGMKEHIHLNYGITGIW